MYDLYVCGALGNLGVINRLFYLKNLMGLFRKITALLNRREKIDKEIETLQKECSHSNKSVRFARENLASTMLSLRWVCDDCTKVLGIPSEKDANEYLIKE